MNSQQLTTNYYRRKKMAEKSEALTQALSRLTMHQPFFAVYMHDMMKIEETTSVPTAATDGQSIFVNPDYLEKLTAAEREFLFAHEIMHGIYQHMPRGEAYKQRGFGPDFKPFSHKRMNIAADYVINATLSESGIGKMPQGGLHRPDVSSADLVDDVYLQVPEDDDDPNGDGHGGFDEHLAPPPNTPPPTDSEVKRAITSAKNAAQAMGKMPGALERLVKEIVEPQVNWKEELKASMTSTAGHDSATWSKPNRRRIATAPHIYMPGSTGFQTGGVCIVVDTSGSISDSMVSTFLGEVQGILAECQPEWCKVLWTDTKVAHVDEVDDPEMITSLKAHGGGGTDMEAAFRHIEDEGYDPEQVVVLTDGYTSYSKSPSFPVIWGMTTDQKPPYGKVIAVKDEP